MTTVQLTSKRAGTSVERALAPVDDGFMAYWQARGAARRRMLQAARATMREYRLSEYGYTSPAALLTSPDAQPKTGKSKVRTLTLMLVPFLSDFGNACPAASAGCGAACLNTAGKGSMPATVRARHARMGFAMAWPWEFGVILAHEILADIRKHGRIGIRLNCVSDIRWELATPRMTGTLAACRRVSMYDYTAWPARLRDVPAGYHLTYSAKETHTVDDIRAMLAHGNVAVPFAVRPRQEMHAQWHGMPVNDGDVSDYRPGDASGVIVGLRAKGAARADRSGFVR